MSFVKECEWERCNLVQSALCLSNPLVSTGSLVGQSMGYLDVNNNLPSCCQMSHHRLWFYFLLKMCVFQSQVLQKKRVTRHMAPELFFLSSFTLVWKQWTKCEELFNLNEALLTPHCNANTILEELDPRSLMKEKSQLLLYYSAS